MNPIIRRVILDILLLLGAFIFPWWALLIAAFACMLRFGMYEAAVVGIFFDALYGGASVWPLHTLIFIVAALLARFLRTRMLWHDGA